MTPLPNNNTQYQNFLPDLCTGQAVFVLVLVAELFAIVLILANSSLTAFDWQSLAFTSLFVQWVALTSAAALCQLRKRSMHWNRVAVASASFLVVLLDTLVFSLLAQWVMQNQPLIGSWWGQAWPEVIKHLVIAAIIGGLVLRYFYVQEELTARQRSELEHRLQALQSRIQPHFLFNSMNTIASLISVDPDRAERVVEDLSELFRASLKEVGSQVPFSRELDLCQRYLAIEQLRLGKRLITKWQVAENTHDVKIPLLTLQPLLENAIYHGIQHLPEGGSVTITARCSEDRFELTVANPVLEAVAPGADNGSSWPQRPRQGNRMALENIGHRLSALYGEQAKFSNTITNGQYITVISYPLK